MSKSIMPAESLIQAFSNPEGKKLNGAPFTVKSLKTQKDYTFYVAQKPFNGHNYLHVSVETQYMDFQYLGYYRDGHILRKGGVVVESPSAAAISWLLRQVLSKKVEVLRENVNVYHMGSCAKCGRPLTDAKSIELGIGPKCRSY